MLLPIGPMNMDLYEEQVEPPSEVRNKHVHFWRFLLLSFVGLFVLQILAVDIFGAVFTGVMGIIVWYMVSNRCLQMSQYCLFMFGLLCVIQTIFETITLLTMVGGRRMQHTTAAQTASAAGGRTTSVTYTTVIETHSFFDSSMGFRYNVQSAMRICSPVIMLVAGLLAYWSYNAFPTGLFSYREEEIRPMMGLAAAWAAAATTMAEARLVAQVLGATSTSPLTAVVAILSAAKR
eukprot:CAMPEP_0171108196 /NCGR_PEP_ID=MMETSP0766_2-20121228/68386_1 /TAXON_ID=439317 /ORGANISM="Gambierdiscus australes, Strain CAWD 149" /LENGTH=233 /DNA_ID=CAMNT_0011569651 /DNA_START=109 /DNA_END=811 /DNA_ORIENTATION=+